MHDEAFPQFVPVDELQSPGLVETVEPVREGANDRAGVEDCTANSGDRQPVQQLGSGGRDI